MNNNQTNLKNVSLNHNGKKIIVHVDEEIYKEVTKDHSSLEKYSSNVFQQLEQNQIKNVEITTEILLDDNVKQFKWTNKLIKLLLEIRLRKESQFNRPSCKKKKLWHSIAEEMTKITNFSITAELCDIKYRNLLSTYRINKKKQKSSGESSVTWEYFEQVDAVLGNKASSIPPPNNLGDSMADIAEDFNDETSNEILTDPSETEYSSKPSEIIMVTPTSSRKRKTDISLQTYLSEKLKRQERREEEKRKYDEDKMIFEKEKWEEKKKLKEKEIEALMALAKALSDK